VDAWDQTLRSLTVDDDLQVTLEFDFGALLGAGRVVFGLAMTSDSSGYVSTWHGGDVIEFNVTSSTARVVRRIASDVVFSIAYHTHQTSMYTTCISGQISLYAV